MQHRFTVFYCVQVYVREGVGGAWVDERTATLSSFDSIGGIVLVVVLVLVHEVLMVVLLPVTMTDITPLLQCVEFLCRQIRFLVCCIAFKE